MRSRGGAGCRTQALTALGPESLLNKEKKRIKSKSRCQVEETKVVLWPQATQLARVTPLFCNVSPDPSLLEPPWVAGGWRKALPARGEALPSEPSGKAASLPAISDLKRSSVCPLGGDSCRCSCGWRSPRSTPQTAGAMVFPDLRLQRQVSEVSLEWPHFFFSGKQCLPAFPTLTRVSVPHGLALVSNLL